MPAQKHSTEKFQKNEGFDRERSFAPKNECPYFIKRSAAAPLRRRVRFETGSSPTSGQPGQPALSRYPAHSIRVDETVDLSYYFQGIQVDPDHFIFRDHSNNHTRAIRE